MMLFEKFKNKAPSNITHKQCCISMAIYFSFCCSFSTSLNLVFVLVQGRNFVLVRTRSIIIFSIVSVILFTSAIN